MTDLKDRTALVTGSTSGIGKATAIALAARGARVLVVGRNEQQAKDVVAEIEGSGGSATYRLTTLADLESGRDLVEWATEAGDGHVDILINNAGVALLGPSSAATEAEFDETFALNVKVPFFLVAAARASHGRTRMGFDRQRQHDGREFRAGRHGHVRRQPGRPGTADQGLGRRIRAEWCPGQRRCPRPTRTALMEALPVEMVNQLAARAPAGRVARPAELAAAIVFLASDDASFVHGVTLAVDGGRVAT